MRDEEKFPTVRFLKCRHCGHVYTASLSGVNECPKCHAPALTADLDERSFRKETHRGHVLFTVTGTVYKLQELENLKSEIEATLKAISESVAFAFTGSSYLDSSLINLLVKTLQTQSQRGKATYLITQDPHVLESLQVLNLDKVLTVFPNLERYREALKA